MNRIIRIVLAAVVFSFFTTNANAKLFDLSAILSGDFEAGDTLAAPVNVSMPTAITPADARPIRQSSVRPEIVAPVQDKTPTTGNMAAKKKTSEEDDTDVVAPVLSGGFSLPSFGSSSVSYSSDINAVRSSITNPSQAMSYMQSNFSYSAHGSDTPYTPEELNSVRAGDCKDLSTFFSWSIADDGYEAPIYVFQYGENVGHVISVYNNGDGWYVQSNLNSYGPISSAMDGMQMAAAYNLPAGTSVGKYREFPTGYVGKLAYE